MAKTAYVFSTLSTDVHYNIWAQGGGDLPVKERHIHIKGGTGVANDRLITPMGVMSEIDEDDIPVLESHPVFKVHAANGYVKIERKKADPEKVAADMNTRDNSAPMSDADYDESDVKVSERK